MPTFPPFLSLSLARREKQDDFQPPALIEDPLREGHNVASGAFRIAEVCRAFGAAHQGVLDQAGGDSDSPLRGVLRAKWMKTTSVRKEEERQQQQQVAGLGGAE